MKVIVGTANFGEEYGWSHVRAKEINKILDTALDLGITTIETAYDYHCLDTLASRKDEFDFIYKADTLEEFVQGFNLGLRPTFMKHHKPYDSRVDPFEIKAGSVYDTNEGGNYTTIEFPYNIIDTRFRLRAMDKGWASGYTNIARSVFIQGRAFTIPDFDGVPFYHVCWNFVRNDPSIDAIVVGVDNAEQLKDIMSIPQYKINYGEIGHGKWIERI